MLLIKKWNPESCSFELIILIKLETYHFIYITNLPSFYKINLFNRIAKKKRILVIFTHEKHIQRNEDFFVGEREFPFVSLANKTSLGKISFIIEFLKNTPYQYLIIGGWDQLVYWVAAFKRPRNKNCVVIESSILESKTIGCFGFLKKIFISRISKTYASGKSQADLMKILGFTGKIIVTKGVGLFNFRQQPQFKEVSVVKNFIYVGRLSSEKNLEFLVKTFNQLPELILNIVGFGPQVQFLKSIAHGNIYFHGQISNKELFRLYLQNDVFILASKSEPWGIVVEEAFNNGLPVIVSNKVGCAEEIVNDSNGIVFNLYEADGLKNAIKKIIEIDHYNSLKRNVCKMNFEIMAENQVNCYL